MTLLLSYKELKKLITNEVLMRHPREFKQHALPEIKLLNILANCHFSDH